MIAVIDYGIGNVNSIINMLKKIGVDACLANKPEHIELADKIILPGVGSFDAGMSKLNESGLLESIKTHAIINKKPMLGICLGMQMLGLKSEEGKMSGLGFIPFENKRFRFNDNQLKIPHMGWDIVSMANINDLILSGIDGTQRYYFVHSYHAVCENDNYSLMKCDYGYPFIAAVKKENIYGFQFHPEKSHKYGMSLLENFARLI